MNREFFALLVVAYCFVTGIPGLLVSLYCIRKAPKRFGFDDRASKILQLVVDVQHSIMLPILAELLLLRNLRSSIKLEQEMIEKFGEDWDKDIPQIYHLRF